MDEYVKATDENLGDLFEGVMIEVTDPFIPDYRVPGWKCKKCGWIIGTLRLPPGHTCPSEGIAQQEFRNSRKGS